MKIRPATEDDVEAALDQFEAVVEEGIWLGAEPPVDRAQRRERMLAALADERSVCLVAVDGDPERAGE
ncbi:MAG: GNAT family N-acetyltransferase, partial [Acidimicrobiales bacterium]